MTGIRYTTSLRQLAHPRGTSGVFRADMDPPKPGEKCALCGQVKKGPEDEAVAYALGIMGLCKRAGLTTLHASKLIGTKLSKSELRALAKLAVPDLKNAIVLRTTADVWDSVIADLGVGKT